MPDCANAQLLHDAAVVAITLLVLAIMLIAWWASRP